MAKKIAKIGQAGFVIITFALLLYRITLHADNYDEIINLNISYRIALGDIPFYHIKDSYQMAAIFLAPFLWLFTKVTGGTTGIVLYSRVLYILVVVGCAVAAYHLFKRYMDKGTAFFLSYVIVFFEYLSLFYLWYDTWAIVFFLLGDIAIVQALTVEGSRKKQHGYLILAGLLHSCMVYAHAALAPMALFIAVVIGGLFWYYRGKRMKGLLSAIGAYALVPITVVLLIVVIGLATAKLDMLISALLGMLIQRGVGSETIDFVAILESVIVSYININWYLVKLTVVLLCVYVVVLFLPKLFPVLAIGIVALPIYNQYLMEETSVRGLPNYLFYLALWAPLLYFMIRRKENIDRGIFYIFFLPITMSILFIPVFSYSGTYGPVKAWQMCLPGALATLYFIVRIWQQKIDYMGVWVTRFLYAIVTLTLLLNAYKYVYLNQPMIEFSDTRLTEGIYAGIKVNSEMEYVLELQEVVERYTEGCETICASGEIRQVYLMTDLRPCAWSTENGTFFDGYVYRWRFQMEYFTMMNQIPDIMFLEYYDLMDDFFLPGFYNNYDLIAEEEVGSRCIYVYKRKGL